MFDAEAIIQINKVVGEQGLVVKPNELHSAFASMPYYETELEKAASVVRSVMQNHPFFDGNKRTGCVLLMSACDVLNIPLNKTDDDIVQFAVQSVIEQWTVNQIVNWVRGR